MIWNKEGVLKNQYIGKNEFVFNKDFVKYEFNENSLFEEYYCFYFWMLRSGGKILYLNAENSIEGDWYTNILYNQEDKPILYHTWYGRLYGISKEHTKRINKVIEIIEKINNKATYIKPIVFKDTSFKGNNNEVSILISSLLKINNLIKKIFINV